ncbi:hypothetical protein OPT61_g294 [Boeremia exigua]|uniref:Uncharacterized protein n=1 Tax=Boeremia exigua TaxID=749465 RepID=A0ACC2IUQ8_9PLEO|nr:hypothetical protein OPT61_g294 [Boeremia exigua]
MIKEATHSATEVLSQPTKWLGMYSDFITKNSSAVSQIESALRSLTYIIPGRFRESEIASESLHCGVQCLSLYHDSLLAKAMAQMPGTRRHPFTPHHRYTKFWTEKSPTYKRIATVLQMIQYTELLWEMAAKRKGEKMRWRVVVLLEFIKAVCRLLLLRLTNSRPLLSPPLPQREVDPSSLEDSSASADGMDTPPSEPSVEAENWTMPRTGLSMPSLPDTSDISSYLLSKVLTADDIKPPKALLHRVSGKGELAEALYILRPVAYALAMQHFSGDRKSWRPWLIGVSIEYGARQLAKKDFQERLAGGLRGLTGLEREELKKRAWALGWWTMRGAFYENITKSWIHAITSKLKSKPLLDIAGGVIEDYEFLWDQYYFSTTTLARANVPVASGVNILLSRIDTTTNAPTTNKADATHLRHPITPFLNQRLHAHTAMPATTAETLSLVTRTVSVAPLVLLSAADHYGRQAKGTRKRVVGVLLGQNDGTNVRVSNSFAAGAGVAGCKTTKLTEDTVPFEEDEKDPSVWFLDHNYVESMNDMFKKINAREKLIGWYHTGPKLRASDLEVNELFKRYTPNPLLVIIDVQPKEVGVPTDAYFAVEEIKDDGTTTSKTFVHTPSVIEAEEAEEIGVEHLLRDIRDVAVGTLSTRITSQLQSLQGLHLRLRDIGQYLQKVLDEDLPVNHAILGNLQDVFNLLPNLSTPKAAPVGGATNGVGAAAGAAGAIDNGELARAMSIKTNDQLMAIYLSSLIRAITAFHDLIENKIQNKQQAEDKEAKKEEGKDGEKEKKADGVNGEAKDGDKGKEKEKAKDEKKKP